MKRSSSLLLFFGIAAVIVLIMAYSFSDGSLQEGYVEKIEKFRAEKDEKFRAGGEDSPLDKRQRENFKGLSYFPPTPIYRVEATLERFPLREMVRINTTTGMQREYIRYGKAVFILQGQRHELVLLAPVRSLDPKTKNMLFLAFTDATTGETTYPAGRYLDLEIPKSDQLVVDFNMAYNPYCAYNNLFDCPIPPKENRMEIPILAGEKDFYIGDATPPAETPSPEG